MEDTTVNQFRSERHDELFRLLSVPTLGPEVRAAWMAFMEEVGADRRAMRAALHHCRMERYLEAEHVLREALGE